MYDFQDYYYFGRGKRKNPGGKLYNKFVNNLTKRKRSSSLNLNNSHSSSEISTDTLPEFDLNIATAVKGSLARETEDWESVLNSVCVFFTFVPFIYCNKIKLFLNILFLI